MKVARIVPLVCLLGNVSVYAGGDSRQLSRHLFGVALQSPLVQNVLKNVELQPVQERLLKNRSQPCLLGTSSVHKKIESRTLVPYYAYRFDLTAVQRPITRLTSGSCVVFSALAIKELWCTRWSKEHEPEIAGMSEQAALAVLSKRIKEKSHHVQERVNEMVSTYGQQEGEQVYLPDEALLERLGKPFFKDIEPYAHIFMLNQEKKIVFPTKDNTVYDWKVCKDITGQLGQLRSFLSRCTHGKDEAYACIIGTFREPFVDYDRVLAFVGKKAGDAGPSFIYIDPLNRGMKKNPQAQLLVSFLVRMALDSRLAPEEKEGLLKRLCDRFNKAIA